MREAAFVAGILVLLFSLLFLPYFQKEVKTSADKQIPAQLLGDPDIELISGNFWISNFDSPDFIMNRADDEYHSPAHSLKISKAVPDSISTAYFSQTYSGQMPYERNLTLQAYIKGLNLEGSGASILLSCNDSNDSILQFAGTEGEVSITGTFDWTSYKLSIINLKKDVKKIYVFLFFLPGTSGTVFFDDITVTPDPLKIQSPAKKNSLLNPVTLIDKL